MGLQLSSCSRDTAEKDQPTCRKGSLTPDMLCSVVCPVVTRVRKIRTSWGTTWREATALSGHSSSSPQLSAPSQPHCPSFPGPGSVPSPAHLSKMLEGCRASFAELCDQRDGAQQDAWGQGRGSEWWARGTGDSTVCVHILPFSKELSFLSHFPPLPTARAEAGNGEPWGLTVVVFMKQFGTNWEEDVRELRDLSDHVHCSQNGLQKSGAQDGPPPTSAMWQKGQLLEGQVPAVPPSHLLAHVGAGTQEQSLHLSGQVPAYLSRAHGTQSAQGQALYCLDTLAQVTAVLGGQSVKALGNAVLSVPTAGSPWDFPVPHFPITLIPSASQNPLTS